MLWNGSETLDELLSGPITISLPVGCIESENPNSWVFSLFLGHRSKPFPATQGQCCIIFSPPSLPKTVGAGKRSGKRWCYCARGSNPEQTVLSVCSPNCCYGEISSERRGPGSLFDVCSNSNGALSGALKSVRARRVFVGVFEPCASAWIQDTGSAAVASLPEVLHFAASCMHYFFLFLLVLKRICGCSTLCFCTGRARVSARYVFSKKFSSPAVALLNSNISIYCYYYCCCCCCYILLEHFRSFKLTKGEMAKVGKPRLCVMTKGENGYGFHLHGEKGKSGQFIRKVEAGSPAEASGLRAGDRLVAVNGVNVEKETHHQASRCVYYLTCVLAGWAGATSTGDTGWCRHPDTVAHSLLLHSASQTRGLQVIELQNILFGNKGRAEQELYAGCIPSLAVFFFLVKFNKSAIL